MNILKKYLKDHRLTMEAFAYTINVSKTSISHWINRRATPRPRVSVRIEKVTKGRIPISTWGYKRDIRGRLFSISTYTRKKNAHTKIKGVRSVGRPRTVGITPRIR